METVVNVDGLEYFANNLNKYITNTRMKTAQMQHVIKAAALSARDGAVAGATQDAVDALEKILATLAQLEEEQKTIGSKVRRYQNPPKYVKRL